MNRLCKSLPEDVLNKAYSILFAEMYLAYQQNVDFLPQFKTNMEKVTELLKSVENISR